MKACLWALFALVTLPVLAHFDADTVEIEGIKLGVGNRRVVYTSCLK